LISSNWEESKWLKSADNKLSQSLNKWFKFDNLYLNSKVKEYFPGLKN
jgi:hypothetical protein